MENSITKETTDILKRLSPKNQTYFMTLVRFAEIVENGVKNKSEFPPSIEIDKIIRMNI